jgi:hypothetical protein
VRCNTAATHSAARFTSQCAYTDEPGEGTRQAGGGRAATSDGHPRHGLVALTVAALDHLQQEHYAVWTAHYKPYGWEVRALHRRTP